MSKKSYNVSTTARTARPRSKRLRALGGTSVTVIGGVGGGAGTVGGETHSHSNKVALDALSIDPDDYLYISQYKETTQTAQPTKARAGYADEAGHAKKADDALRAEEAKHAKQADNADKWDDKEFSDYLDQPVRKGDKVQFGQVTTPTLVTPDFTPGGFAGAGAGLTRDANGQMTLEVDNIVARRRLNVNEVIINQSTHVGGRTLFSAANMECVRVEDGGTYWRCYFDTKNGQKANLWQKDDLAYFQQYSADNTQILRYYWRLVTSVGEDWINLSKTTCDTGSGAPAVGDNIVQVGNLTDRRRQSMLEIDMMGASRVVLYAGISTFSFVDRNEGALGVDQNGNPYFYCYGDSFLGDRNLSDPDATYITFQTPEGETRRRMIVSADLHIGRGSTGLANLSEWHTKQAEIDRAGQAAAEAKDKVDNLQVGDRNLLLQSNKGWKNSDYNIAQINIGDYKPSEGEECTIVIKGKPEARKEGFTVYNSGASVYIASIPAELFVDNIATQTFKWRIQDSANTSVHIFAPPYQLVAESQIEWVKLVVGNKTSAVWSPAPEDVKAQIDGIQIGGVNFAKNSVSFSGWEGNNYNISTDGIMTIASTGEEWWKASIPIYANANEEYTCSYLVKTENLDKGIILPVFYDGNWRSYEYMYPEYKDTAGAWVLVSKTFKTTVAGHIRMSISNYHNTSGIMYAQKPKLERGNKATSWSPAPEDVKAEIDNIQVGSVNLVDSSYNADCWTGNSGQYPIHGWVNADNQPYIRAGKTYTLVSELSVSDDFNGLGVCFFISGGKQIGEPFKPRTPTVVSVTFTAGIDGILSAYHYLSGSAGVSRIKWVKLVEGNKADNTWSESPADTKAYADQAAAQVQTSAVNYLKDSRYDNLSHWITREGTVTLVEDPKFGTVVQYQRTSGSGDFQLEAAIYNRSQLSNCDVIYYVIAKNISGDGIWAFGGWPETVNRLSYASNSIDLGDGWKMYWVTFKSGATLGGTFGINSITGTWQFFAAGVSLGKNPPSSWTIAEGNLTDSITITTARLERWASDDIISPVEKTGLRQQRAAIEAEYAQIKAEAERYGISIAAYDAAYNAALAALNKYCADTPAEISVVPAEYAHIAAYYTAAEGIRKALGNAADVNLLRNDIAKDLGYADYAEMERVAKAGKTIIEGGKIRTELLEASQIVAMGVDVVDGSSRVKISPDEGMTLLENNKVTAKFTGAQIGSVLDNIPVNSNVLITEQKSRFSDTPENGSTTLTLALGVISGTSTTPVTIEIPPIRIYALMKLIRSEWTPRTTMYVNYLVNGVTQSSFEFTIQDFEEYEEHAGYDQGGYPIYETRYQGEMGRQITTPAFFITANSSNNPVLVQVRYSFRAQPDPKDVWDNKLYAQFPGSALEAVPASKYLDVGGRSFNSTFYGNGLIFSKSTNQIVGMSATAEGTELIARSGSHGLKVDKTGVARLKSDGSGWDNSGLLCGYHVNEGGTFATRFGIKDKPNNRCGFQRNPGVYRLTHNIGHTDYVASVIIASGGFGFTNIGAKSANYVDVEMRNYDEMLINRPFMILIFGRP